MALNFSVNERGDLLATFSHDANSLRAVGQVFASDNVQEMVRKKAGELNLIAAALKCLETFNTRAGLTADLISLRESQEFADKYQEFVNEYHSFGFNLKELEILTYAHFSKIREWKQLAMAHGLPREERDEEPFVGMRIPHRPAPPPPPPQPPIFLRSDQGGRVWDAKDISAAREEMSQALLRPANISRPTIPPPLPPPTVRAIPPPPSVRPKTHPKPNQPPIGIWHISEFFSIV